MSRSVVSLDGPGRGPRSSFPRRPASPLRRALSIVTIGWVFGAVWQTLTTGTPLTLFAEGLKATPFQFGVLTALPFIASLATLPGSLLIEAGLPRKRVFLLTLMGQRLLWFPLALLPMWVLSRAGSGQVGLALGLFLVLSLVMNACGSVGGPAWVSWMADVVPARMNGKYFSRRRQWGIATAVPAALFAGFFLDRQSHQGPAAVLTWCAVLFMAAAVFGVADIGMFQFLPEPARPPRAGRLLDSLATPTRDRPFLIFSGLVASLTFTVSFTGQFATLYLLDVVKVDNLATQLMLVVAPMAAQWLVLPAWGLASDRLGKKPLLVLAGLGMAPVSLGWCLLSPGHAWMGYALALVQAALWTGVEVANFNGVIEAAGAGETGRGSGYIAVNSVITNIGGCLGGLAAGGLAQCLQHWRWQPAAGLKAFTFYDVLFASSGALRLASVLAFAPLIHEPTARSASAALRFLLYHFASCLKIKRPAHIEEIAPAPTPHLPQRPAVSRRAA